MKFGWVGLDNVCITNICTDRYKNLIVVIFMIFGVLLNVLFNKMFEGPLRAVDCIGFIVD